MFQAFDLIVSSAAGFRLGMLSLLQRKGQPTVVLSHASASRCETLDDLRI